MREEPKVTIEIPSDGDDPAALTAVGGRPGWAALVLAAPALVLAVITSWALVTGWRPAGRIDTTLTAMVFGWPVLVLLLLAFPPCRRILARHWAQLTALVASLCLALVGAELVLASAMPYIGGAFHCRRPGLTVVQQPNPQIMRGVQAEATARYNVWGVRGTDPPPRDEAMRILCVGGSSTACTYLDDSTAWPQVLAGYLHQDDPETSYWAGNAGKPGYRTDEHLRFLETTPLLRQVDCIVIQAGINDFMSCLTGPKPRPPLWKRSNLLQLLRTLLFQATTGDVLVEDAGGTGYVRRRAMRAAAPIDSSPPDLDDCLRQFESNLHALIDICKQHGVRLVFTTQPVLWREDLDDENQTLLWFGRSADGRYLSVEQLRAGMDRYNDALRRVCDTRQVEWVDLSSLNGDPAAFYDDCHYTDAGSQRVARLIANRLAAHSLRSASGDAR